MPRSAGAAPRPVAVGLHSHQGGEMGPLLPGNAEGVIDRLGQPLAEPGQGAGRGGERSHGHRARLLQPESGRSVRDPQERHWLCGTPAGVGAQRPLHRQQAPARRSAPGCSVQPDDRALNPAVRQSESGRSVRDPRERHWLCGTHADVAAQRPLHRQRPPARRSSPGCSVQPDDPALDPAVREPGIGGRAGSNQSPRSRAERC